MVHSDMRWLTLLFAVTALQAQNPMWPLERLYTRPFVWGTRPDEIAWARRAPIACFLWNEEGNRFLDLYCASGSTGKRTRLTRLESLKDDFWIASEAKDSRRKNYLMPEPGLSSFTLSDDGSRAAFLYKGDLFTVPTDASAPPFRWTRTKAPETAARFSPGGRALATLRGGQIHTLDLTSGQLWQVTDFTPAAEGSIVFYSWSPDGTRFLVMTRKGTTRQLPLPNYSGQFVTAPNFARSVAADEPLEYALRLIDASGGEPRSLKPPPFGRKLNPDLPVWSPDSRRILWPVISADHKKQDILVYDAATGEATVAAHDEDERWVFASAAGWSPDSSRIFFNSERDGFAHIYTSGHDGKDPRQLTSGKWEARGEVTGFTCADPHWRDDGYLYFNSTEAGTAQRQFYRIRGDGTGKERLSPEGGVNCGLASHDGARFALLRATTAQPFDLWIGSRRITESPRPGFSSIPWPEMRYVSFPSRGDRAPVAGKLMLPPGYNPAARSAKPLPAVVYIHGAGIATSILEQWGSYQELRWVFNAWLASQGYAVLDLDYRGSTGYGRDWRTGVYLHMGGKDLDDVLGGVDYLASLGNIDTRRIGIWGVSYGGFMTDMAMFTAPGVFRAGASWAAVNDWENYSAGYTQERLNTPQSNPEAYRRSSPIIFSHNLKDPLLIIHGMVDSNVLFQDAVQLTEKLIHEGKSFEHFYYPEEDHGFVRDETLRDAFRRTAAFFERHLR